MEQKKLHGPEWELQVKQTCPLLGQPNLQRAGSKGERDKSIKGESQDGLRPLLWGQSTPTPQGVLFFGCQIKLSCNWAVTLGHCFKFLLWWDGTEEITHCLDITWCCFWDLTWLKQSWLGPQKLNLAKAHMVEAEHEENPGQWTWQEAQRAGNQDSKNTLGRKLTWLSLKFQKISS